MLALKNIIKDYVSGDNVTHALKGVSVNFRKNEFVSILGPSGCGKTTLLNIIGGLDRYTNGDLLIAGKSTKEYKDRDWDTYRNHSIGFVFQTYNLISHQNILKNVELALTISGVSKEERKDRAYQALKTVGLEGMEKKKPNQLSGGQCQRVAIARALVNNPEILLADEPTGALDSETSVQIMNLLKEVASDRLVIMVTHNPDLAYKYSTRIIKMSDGLLTEDSLPFDEKEEKAEIRALKEKEVPPEESKGKKKNSSMSLWTSIGLSTSNLLSKLKRTVLVTIAGSIGIIGVSAVLGASRGVKDYISDLQNDMLSSYPVTIAEESVDYASLMTGLNNQDVREKFQFDPENPRIGVDSMISYLMSAYSDITNVKTNTIDHKLLDFINSDEFPKEGLGAVDYDYGIEPTNNIFAKWKDQTTDTNDFHSFNGITQRFITELKTVTNFGAYASFVDLFTGFMHELPDNVEYISDQYDVIKDNNGCGFSTDVNDLVLVVDQDTTLTDILLAQMGVFDHDSFIHLALCAMAEQDLKKEPGFDKLPKEEQNAKIQELRNREEYKYDRDFSYEDIINRDFYYFPQQTIYTNLDYDLAPETFNLNFTYVDGSTLDTFANLQFQTIMGLNCFLGTALIFNTDTSEYESKTVARLSDDLILNPSKEYETKSDFVGSKWFAFDLNDLPSDFKGMSIAEILDLLNNAKFVFNIKDTTHVDFWKEYGDYLHPNPPLTELDASWPESAKINEKCYVYNSAAKQTWIDNLDDSKGMKMRISSILRLKKDNKFGTLSRGLYYTKKFGEKFISDSNNEDALVTNDIKAFLKDDISKEAEYTRAYVTFDTYYDYTKKKLSDKMGYASSLNSDLSSSFSDLFSGLTGRKYDDVNAKHLRSLSGYKVLFGKDDTTFDLLPKSISFYPKSFEAKDKLTSYLDKWNSDEVLTIKGTEYSRSMRDELTYTDTISLIASLIDTFIDAITIALVVFTSLSLVVSCFMIAVITYISVVERIKEIGVIRSLGGRKGDVAALFIMETLMTGLFSGVFGVTITYILQIIVNIVLKAVFGIAIIHLTIPTALIMIAISVALSVLSGLIPSQSAAHKDPVVALRSNE